METVNIHEAKTNLSKLVDRASKGEPFIIAKAGKPMVTVMAIEATASNKQMRLGFLTGQFNIPDDFDSMGTTDIIQLFVGSDNK